MYEALVQRLLNDKNKGLKVEFKTDGNKYFIFIANGRYATLNNKEFTKFFTKWKTATTLLSL